MKIYQKNLTEMKQIVDDYTSATVAPQIVATVAELIQTVRQEGDAALRNYGAQFDKVDVKEFATFGGDTSRTGILHATDRAVDSRLHGTVFKG